MSAEQLAMTDAEWEEVAVALDGRLTETIAALSDAAITAEPTRPQWETWRRLTNYQLPEYAARSALSAATPKENEVNR